MKDAAPTCSLFTIGHSGHSLDRFLKLLVVNGVTAVADVRSRPYSRFNPQFNREVLGNFLRSNRIYYVFLGDELGARRVEPECYVANKARYDRIVQLPTFQSGLTRVRNGLADHRIALMCAEKDPITCHRSILVCRHLRDGATTINHILEDGSLESGVSAESRLLGLLRLDMPELFGSREEMVERAYDAQAEKIAYVRSGEPSDDQGV